MKSFADLIKNASIRTDADFFDIFASKIPEAVSDSSIVRFDARGAEAPGTPIEIDMDDVRAFCLPWKK